MLQQQHLILISAALQYWTEEMDLEDSKIFEIYAGSDKIELKWREADIQRLRMQLLTAQLRYAVCQSNATSVKNSRLFSTIEAATQVLGDESDQLGAVLVIDPAI
ncbi:hypothetical protein [Gimesia fumaroli]|uniref:Uncharacterized protein n=1 Tax=Gimesia fumaroli TaxID=2527976 RepID=A0A518IGD5_9PLAN|nr:hypothetical protein [Gimesia fumaroli]QDV52151.1 hypothetical protein Enr17x_42110 [Gimesia fumaroli]